MTEPNGGAQAAGSEAELPDGAHAWIAAARGAPVTGVSAVPPGAGARRYWRVHLADGATAVLMHALPESPRILPPALRASANDIPFIEVTHFLAGLGCPVPEIYAIDRPRRWLLLEDLGPTRLCDLAGEARLARHREAIDLLARVHASLYEAPGRTDAASEPGAEPPLPLRRRYDPEWITFELELALALEPGVTERDALRARTAPLVTYIADLPPVLSLRDYQSQNLLIDPRGALRVIDYQDAFLAPAALDLAALLHDSYVPLDRAARAELLERYGSRARRRVSAAELAAVVVHRKAKDASRYILMIEERGRLEFTPYLARAIDSIREVVPELPAALADAGAALAALVDVEPVRRRAGGSAA